MKFNPVTLKIRFIAEAEQSVVFLFDSLLKGENTLNRSRWVTLGKYAY